LKIKGNILVVDDEQAHTLLIAELLKKSGYTVNVANDGFKALAACRVRTPDLIILDLFMPMMGGMDVFNRLRNEDKLRQIPIIFLGVKDKPTPNIRAVAIAEEDILFKPFEPNELLARVKSVLKQTELSEKLVLQEQQLRELALDDPLTTLKTPRYLKEFVRTNARQSRRYNTPFTAVIMQIDNYNVLFESHGKHICDQLVAYTAKFIAGHLRDSDVVARTDEAEITLVLTMTERKGAIEVAERLRHAIRQTEFVIDGQSTFVTVSVGLCQFNKAMNDDGDLVLSHARAAVKQAKESGGDVTLMAE
jgi:two-component system, cell cycle response regulator